MGSGHFTVNFSAHCVVEDFFMSTFVAKPVIVIMIHLICDIILNHLVSFMHLFVVFVIGLSRRGGSPSVYVSIRSRYEVIGLIPAMFLPSNLPCRMSLPFLNSVSISSSKSNLMVCNLWQIGQR